MCDHFRRVCGATEEHIGTLRTEMIDGTALLLLHDNQLRLPLGVVETPKGNLINKRELSN